MAGELGTNVLMTELEAVNASFRAAGEMPLAALGSGHAWEAIAIDILRDTITEVQLKGWKFNTDFQYRIPRNEGADPAADTFTVPSNTGSDPGDLLAFRPSERNGQLIYGRNPKQDDGTYANDPGQLDIVARGTLFWSRLHNATTFGDATDRPQIFLDCIWALDFTECPHSFRNFVAVRGARRFAYEVLGDKDRGRFKELDETGAWNLLVQDQGDDDETVTIFDNMMDSYKMGTRNSYWIRNA